MHSCSDPSHAEEISEWSEGPGGRVSDVHRPVAPAPPPHLAASGLLQRRVSVARPERGVTLRFCTNLKSAASPERSLSSEASSVNQLFAFPPTANSPAFLFPLAPLYHSVISAAAAYFSLTA